MRSRTLSIPSSPSILVRRSETPWSRVTSMSRRARRVRPLLNPEQVGVKRLTALVHLERDLGVLFGEPFFDAAGVGHAGALAFDQRDQLVALVEETAEQEAGADDDVVGDGDDAVVGDADPVALVHFAGVGTRLADGLGHLGRDD